MDAILAITDVVYWRERTGARAYGNSATSVKPNTALDRESIAPSYKSLDVGEEDLY